MSTQRVTFLNVTYDLQAYKESVGLLSAAYDLQAYDVRKSYLNASYDVLVYKDSVGYLGASYDLLACKSLTAYLNGSYDLNAPRQAVAYLSASYDLLACKSVRAYLNVSYDLLCYQPHVTWLNAGYDLFSYKPLSSAYLNASYDVLAYENRVQYLGASYDIAAYQAKISYLQAYYDLLADVQYTGYALNLATGALSELQGFNFNSLAGNLGADSDGIYLIEGSTNNGAAIPAFIESGTSDLGDSHLKRFTDGYIAKEGGKLKLTVTTDNGSTPYIFDKTDQLKTVKQNLGRGAKGRFLKLKLEAIQGSSSSVDNIEINVEPLHRKV